MKNWFGKFPQVLASSGKKHRILKYPILLLSLFMTALCRGIDAAGTLARPAIRRRMLAAAISACMVITMLPLQAFATEPTQNAGSLCEHHPAHTAECGYTEGMAETPCTHDHTEDCYQEVTDCIHEHMAECYTENDSVSDNNATPSDAEEKEPAECTHICDEDTGCITQELDCTHERGEHDDTCGYTKETEGMPCAYVCEICYPAEKDTEIRLMEANEPTVTASGRDWELDGSGNLTISTADGMADWVLNGLRENKDSIKTAIIVEAVTDIPGSAFYQCTSLTNVTAPAVKTIRSDAFNRCKALTGASFPVAESIGSSAFYKCTSLTDVTAPAVKTIGNGAFYSCTALTGASFPVATNIGVMAFGSCKALTSASFPVATYISSAAFSECAALTSIDFPNAVNIESNAFSECKALTSIDFPAVETIDGYALYNCSALTNANFPTVKTIGSNALYNCSGLATLSLPAAPPSVTDVYAFSKCPPTRSLIFVDTTGTALTGNALTSAQAAYKAVDDSRMSGEAANNNTWYGWRI